MASSGIRVAQYMTRNILALALAARKAETSSAWASLGFVVDEGGVAFADGVTLDFLPQGTASLIGFSGDPDACLTERPRAIPGGDCRFALARLRKTRAPVHPNGALGLKSVAFLGDDPADHAELLSKITGQREMLATSAGLEIGLDGGTFLLVLTPAAFAFRFGGAAPENGAFRLAGLTFRVDALGASEKMLHSVGAVTKIQAGRLLAGESENLGAALAFEAD
jgi:hypothetical protein